MTRPRDLEEALERALGGRSYRYLEACASTNDEAIAWARQGAPDLSLVIADAQTSGRGRKDRRWVAGRGEALLCSVILGPMAARGPLPLLVGVAVAEAIDRRTGVSAALKWPNDLLHGDRKLGGILCEAVGERTVAGIGVNVAGRPEGLDAVSLAEAGAMRLDRADLAAGILDQIDGALRAPEAALERWRKLSATLGSEVRIEMADGSTLLGAAEDIEPSGALIVREAGGSVRTVTAGDVTHLRGAE